MKLEGSTAIVTGAGRGIGRALAVEFATHGMNVVCAARREHEIKGTTDLIKDTSGDALAVPTDITDPAAVGRMVDKTLDHFGQIDVLFNNAASFGALGPIWSVDADQWWHDIRVNLRGTMLCSQAVQPHMIERDSGIVINMAGGDHIPGGTGYSCSKVALVRLTELMAKECEHDGYNIFVFTMGPGFVRTEMTEYQIEAEEGRKWLPSSQDSFDRGADRPPEDCARATVELLRIACPQLNGQRFGTGTNWDEVHASLK